MNKKTVHKDFIKTDLNIHQKIRKSEVVGTNKQASTSSIYKYK